MAEAKAAAIPDKKEKSFILDDDAGKDILNSWKSISGTEGAVDFKLEPIGKSKKKDFSFENLDMDFDLVSDFGKISSFKMDMSDLDFSFSPKKNKKAIEKEGDSGSVNFQGKEDRFNFSFDFNSLGNFDIDAPMSKVDTLSRKQKDSQKLDTDRTDCQVSEIQVNEVTIADVVNKPKRGQASETVGATKVHVYDTLMTDNHPLRSEVSDDIVLQPEVEISSDKADRKGREDTANHSNIPVYQHIIQNFDVQSNPTKKKGEGNLMESLKEGYSSDTGVKTNVEGDQSICYNELVALEAVHEKTPECAPPRIAEPLEDNSKRNKILSYCNGKEPSIYIEDVVERGSNLGRSPKIVQSKTSELSKDGSIIANNTFADVKESSDGVFDSHDTSVARAVKIVHREIKTQLSPLSNRESMVNKSTSGNEKETNIVQSKFFSRSDETDKLNHEASFFIKPKYVKMQTVHSDSPSEIREPNACEKQIGISAGADFVSNKKVAKGENTLLRNQRTLITAKEISSSNSKEKSSKKESQKSEKTSIASIMDCTQSIRHISTAKDNPLPLKSVTRSLDLTDLKSSRRIGEKKLQPIFATMKEIKSLKVLKQKVHENVPPKVTSLNLTEKRKPGTPTLKRKQAPTGGLVLEIPLKRLSQSPRDSSKNVSDMKMKEQVQHQNNTVNINTRDHLVDMPRIPKFDTPGQMNSSIVETEMGNYGIVEKAEAYGKDLDDLCNMLKKKHEEAKELLVRAVINNNNLLLLNHPMHNEKIRSVQKLANRLMAMEIIPRPR